MAWAAARAVRLSVGTRLPDEKPHTVEVSSFCLCRIFLFKVVFIICFVGCFFFFFFFHLVQTLLVVKLVMIPGASEFLDCSEFFGLFFFLQSTQKVRGIRIHGNRQGVIPTFIGALPIEPNLLGTRKSGAGGHLRVDQQVHCLEKHEKYDNCTTQWEK